MTLDNFFHGAMVLLIIVADDFVKSLVKFDNVELYYASYGTDLIVDILGKIQTIFTKYLVNFLAASARPCALLRYIVILR